MLARVSWPSGLEIAVGCHYHSGLKLSGPPWPQTQPVERQVIIKIKHVLSVALLVIAGAPIHAFAVGDPVAGAELGYRDGTRSHPTMDAQAASLTDQQIEDVAAYLASLGAETVMAGGSTAPSIEQTSTCIACHGQNGVSMSPTWPTLAGQHEDYLEHALNQYRDGTRTDSVMAPMATMLTDDDVALLARYYSSLDGLETTEAD